MNAKPSLRRVWKKEQSGLRRHAYVSAASSSESVRSKREMWQMQQHSPPNNSTQW